MANLILGTVGRAIGGPVGGIIGGLLGSTLDRALLGGGKAREGARLGNLSVQSSAYGEPLPKIFGRMRVAGNLIWTAGIAERSTTSGGGKRGGQRTTNYSYSASFAVALSARAVTRIARIWADGKLLRDAAGAWLQPATMRVHLGGEGQAVDPLIAAAEGGAAPAYRGLAYAVFEDLELAEYGNRIPNLTFEMIADAGPVDAGQVVAALCADARVAVTVAGVMPGFGGFAAMRGGDLRTQLSQLGEVFDLRFVDDGTALTARAGGVPGVAALNDDDLGSVAGDANADTARAELRAAAGQIDDAVTIGFYDAARDFQPGLQRAVRRAGGTRSRQLDVPMALDAATAKGLAAALLARAAAARTSATLRLPWRALGVRAGTQVARPGDTRAWSVRRWGFANFVVELAVECQPVRVAGVATADPGRVHDSGDAAAGPTVLQVLDLPPLFGTAVETPRLWLAAAGASPGWRRAGIALSSDRGESYAGAGEIGAPSAMGSTATALAAGSGDRWDRANSVEVVLLADAMWLESRSEAAVLGGANLAVIGGEVMQFAEATVLGARRFRLSGLLRGRRGSAVAAHVAGSRFVMLDAERLLAVDPSPELLGRVLRVRAAGSGDAVTPAVEVTLTGNALRPLSPVFLQARSDGGDTVFSWVRRSRSGFAWSDAVDAPLGEAREAYRVELSAGAAVRTATVERAEWRYTAAMRAADGTGAVTLAVAQLGDVAGPGLPASRIFTSS